MKGIIITIIRFQCDLLNTWGAFPTNIDQLRLFPLQPDKVKTLPFSLKASSSLINRSLCRASVLHHDHLILILSEKLIVRDKKKIPKP